MAFPQNLKLIGTNVASAGPDSSNVTASATGSVLERLEQLRTIMTQPGTAFNLAINVTSSAIPNNTQTAGAITGAASGAIVIDDILLDTDGTGVAGPTNINFTTDNASGLTGASAPICAEAVSALGANKSIGIKIEGTTKHVPFYLESGKKLYISGSNGAGTGAGVLRITLMCRRVAAAGSLAAGGIGT